MTARAAGRRQSIPSTTVPLTGNGPAFTTVHVFILNGSHRRGRLYVLEVPAIANGRAVLEDSRGRRQSTMLLAGGQAWKQLEGAMTQSMVCPSSFVLHPFCGCLLLLLVTVDASIALVVVTT